MSDGCMCECFSVLGDGKKYSRELKLYVSAFQWSKLALLSDKYVRLPVCDLHSLAVSVGGGNMCLLVLVNVRCSAVGRRHWEHEQRFLAMLASMNTMSEYFG